MSKDQNVGLDLLIAKDDLLFALFQFLLSVDLFPLWKDVM